MLMFVWWWARGRIFWPRLRRCGRRLVAVSVGYASLDGFGLPYATSVETIGSKKRMEAAVTGHCA